MATRKAFVTTVSIILEVSIRSSKWLIFLCLFGNEFRWRSCVYGMGNLVSTYMYILVKNQSFKNWSLFFLFITCSQGSRWRAIQAKKSPCEGWLRFLVCQKRSSSRLVMLKSCPMSLPAYFLHLSFMKMLISCTCLLKYIVSIIKYFESDFLGK